MRGKLPFGTILKSLLAAIRFRASGVRASSRSFSVESAASRGTRVLGTKSAEYGSHLSTKTSQAHRVPLSSRYVHVRLAPAETRLPGAYSWATIPIGAGPFGHSNPTSSGPGSFVNQFGGEPSSLTPSTSVSSIVSPARDTGSPPAHARSRWTRHLRFATQRIGTASAIRTG